MRKIINTLIKVTVQKKKCVFYSIIFVLRLFSYTSQLSRCCLEHYMIEISSCGYYVHLFQRQSNPWKYSCSNRSSALFIGMHLGNLKRTHIKTYCNVINTVTLKDVSARKEETIMNLTGITLLQEDITWDGIVLWWLFKLFNTFKHHVLMSSQDVSK